MGNAGNATHTNDGRRYANLSGHGNNSIVPQYCKDCAKYKYCDMCHDERLRENCRLLEDDVPLRFRNSEGYADPTTYYALLNVDRELKAKRRQGVKR